MEYNYLKYKHKNQLLKSVLNGWTKTVEELVKMKVSLNETDDMGRTALIWAVINKEQQMVQTLINGGADLNIKDKKSNWTALDYAIYTRQEDMAEMLIRAGAKVNMRSGYYQWIPLMRASASGLEKTVRCLLEHKADMNATDDTMNETALICAVYAKRPQIVKLLIEAGANMDIRNKAGRRVVDIAYDLRRNSHEDDVIEIYHLCVDGALKSLNKKRENFFSKLFKKANQPKQR